MFFPVPDKDSHSVHNTDQKNKVAKNRNNKKHRKQKQRLEKRIAKRKNTKKSSISSAMTSWAENFAVAATWQLKHQLAYWKAKAISLEYENNILHEAIRKNHIAVSTSSKGNGIVSHRDTEFDYPAPSEKASDFVENQDEENDSDYTESESESDEAQNDNEEGDFEVSEEFIQFLTANAKYKEDARLERQRLKAKLEEESEQCVQEPRKCIEEEISRKKELYGDKFEKIVALEMYLMSDFKNELDKHKATYWPNIPFNFNSS